MSSPKEKAEDLANRVVECEVAGDGGMYIPTVRNLCLLCVDELIQATQRYSINEEDNKVEVIPLQYWLDVRDEVLKLTFI